MSSQNVQCVDSLSTGTNNTVVVVVVVVVVVIVVVVVFVVVWALGECQSWIVKLCIILISYSYL